jgi:hypothetical protein
VDDLVGLPDGPVIAEGRTLLPDLIAPILRSPDQALYLLVPSDVHRSLLGRRRTASGAVPNPAAIDACVARDRELADLIRERAAALDVRVVEVEHPADAAAAVERHFTPALWSGRFD